MAENKFILDDDQAKALRQILSTGHVPKEEGRRLVEAVGIQGRPCWESRPVDTGGPAYPGKANPPVVNIGDCPRIIQNLTPPKGMTFLDVSALAALQGIISSDPIIAVTANKPSWAAAAYDFAEAMVAEKRKRENGQV